MNRISEMPLDRFEQVFRQFLTTGQVPEGMHNGLWGMLVQMLEDEKLILQDPS